MLLHPHLKNNVDIFMELAEEPVNEVYSLPLDKTREIAVATIIQSFLYGFVGVTPVGFTSYLKLATRLKQYYYGQRSRG